MKCMVVVVSLVAFCSLGYGREITFTKNSQNLEKDIEIAVPGPSGVYKKIHVNEDNNSKSVGFQEPLKSIGTLEDESAQPGKLAEADVFSAFLQQHGGVYDEQSDEDLSRKGSFLNGFEKTAPWPQEEPSFNDRYAVPQRQYHGLDSRRSAYLPFYKQQQKNVYQQWMNRIKHQQALQFEQEGYKMYLQLMNINQAHLSPVQQRQLNLVHQQWITFQNQLRSEEQRDLYNLFEQWANCGRIHSAEQQQCGKLYSEWILFQERLGTVQRHMLSNIVQQWTAVQQEVNLGQLSRFEQLFFVAFQQWISLEMTPEQQQNLIVMLPRWINYKQLQPHQYDNFQEQSAVFYQELSVEQQQILNNFYQIFVTISRLQINPGEWIQLRQQLNNYIHHLVSGQQGIEVVQNQYFLKLYQRWVICVESLINLEQGLFKIYQDLATIHNQLNVEQLQQFRAIFNRWISLRMKRVSGIWSQLHEEQFEIVNGQWMELLQQLPMVQQHLLNDLTAHFHGMEQLYIDSEAWYTLVQHLDVFVHQLIASDRQGMGEVEVMEFFEIYRLWVRSVEHGIEFVPTDYYSGTKLRLSQHQTSMFPHGLQEEYSNQWPNYMMQNGQQNHFVPNQFHYRHLH